MEKGYIIPLNKTRTPQSVEETRPVDNSSHMAKIFEMNIAQQILDYFVANKIIVPNQYGYLKNHSPQKAILQLTDAVRGGI